MPNVLKIRRAFSVLCPAVICWGQKLFGPLFRKRTICRRPLCRNGETFQNSKNKLILKRQFDYIRLQFGKFPPANHEKRSIMSYHFLFTLARCLYTTASNALNLVLIRKRKLPNILKCYKIVQFSRLEATNEVFLIGRTS